ncbi:probable high affinity nitrate transporter transmembrane protein [Roseobacter sp. SK209-2-6]|uniref:MFS transporter n=1 Tax=Roseobacter sp. SK209-2-6 TaxID=388739 RepID=UPI0000F3ED12|nr:MFS transporter [Roseobacter sp. SK209-2-6]EBA15573.1 probable high affinity nitrate transporter transmembrane protein [Roseobacter sp. SK209-2-6]
MEIQNKATSLWGNFFNVKMVQIRTFHMTWFAFFSCFFAWFGIAPLMIIVRDELQLTKSQVGWSIIASVAVTVFARFFIGWLCDRIGPRLSYTYLLIFGAFPVAGIGLADSFEMFLFFRLFIGVIGAAFVITQYHTTVMFAPNVVGTANATSAGWGNLGGGVTQFAMPMVFSMFVVGFGFSDAVGWRLSMMVVGGVIFVVGIAYYFLTQDAPEGNYKELREQGKLPPKKSVTADYFKAMADYRVWILFLIYGACFGIELTVNNVAALYFYDYFDLSLVAAGGVAASFGLMNIFARTLGGIFGDNFGALWGLKGRSFWLFIVLLGEGCALMIFSQMQVLFLALPMLIIFSLFTQMAEGATYSVVPFINKKALGAVAGVVGAGGNAGAVAAGFLFKGAMEWNDVFFVIGVTVACASVLAFFVRFSEAQEEEERANFEHASLDLLRVRAERANNALAQSVAVVEEWNRKHPEAQKS